MCGLAGIWRRRGPIDPRDRSDVLRMADAIRHRGPDDHGSWNDNRLAVGHRRLSIIDPSPSGHQPMLTASQDAVLVYNGEVYNYQAIREQLRAEGLTFRSDCDTEVVLLALRHWGPRKAVPLFDGMFAFAYYDLRAGELWLARDRLGIKPMSVADLGDRILFASEDKAILAAGDVARDVDTREITLRLAWQSRDSSSSLFRNIDRLQPGGLWRIDASGIEKTCFWHVLDVLDPSRVVGDRASTRDHMISLESMLSESVEMHCRADTAMATACSRGVDSGMITVLSRRYRQDFHAYVLDPRLGPSEAEGAALTAAHAGVPLRRVPLDRERFIDLWPKMVWHLESDGWHGSAMGLLALTEQCKTDAVKVLLTGEGSDELFGGYPWQRRRMRQWRTLSTPWRMLFGQKAFDRKVLKARRAPLAQTYGNPPLLERYNVLRSLAPELNFLEIKLFDLLEPVTPLADRAYLAGCLFDMYSHLQDLLHRHDRLSMAASVELRVPFLENSLIDFAIHLPRRFKHRWSTTKWLLKKVAQRHMPMANIHAPKSGFEVSHQLSVGAEKLLRGGLLADAMRWPSSSIADIENLAREHENSRMRLVGMELFLRLYAGGESQEQLSERLRAVMSEPARA